jgi:hypothetical protein
MVEIIRKNLGTPPIIVNLQVPNYNESQRIRRQPQIIGFQ